MSTQEVQRLMSEARDQGDVKQQLLDNAHLFLGDLGFDLTPDEAIAVLLGTPQDLEQMGVNVALARTGGTCLI